MMMINPALPRLLAALMLTPYLSQSQNIKRQTDKHIVHQQERMVHKSWNRRNFTPTKGFLGLNYQYWLTWAWHPNYPKTDRRPLSAMGPQTLRMGMVLAMQSAEQIYKLQSDTIKQEALTRGAGYSGLLTSADPLWTLYYKREFGELLNPDAHDPLAGLPERVKNKLRNNESLTTYNQDLQELAERLEGARSADMDRGSRILSYHHLLADYRKLQSRWKAAINFHEKFMKLMENNPEFSDDDPPRPPVLTTPKSDKQIAEEILKNIY